MIMLDRERRVKGLALVAFFLTFSNKQNLRKERYREVCDKVLGGVRAFWRNQVRPHQFATSFLSDTFTLEFVI
jgi:hypothetical protein